MWQCRKAEKLSTGLEEDPQRHLWCRWAAGDHQADFLAKRNHKNIHSNPSFHLCKPQPLNFLPKTPMTNSRPSVWKITSASLLFGDHRKKEITPVGSLVWISSSFFSSFLFFQIPLHQSYLFLSSRVSCFPSNAVYVVTTSEFLLAKASHGAALGFRIGKHWVWRDLSRMPFPSLWNVIHRKAPWLMQLLQGLWGFICYQYRQSEWHKHCKTDQIHACNLLHWWGVYDGIFFTSSKLSLVKCSSEMSRATAGRRIQDSCGSLVYLRTGTWKKPL